MSPLWVYLWPPLAFAIALGLLSGLLAFRRHRAIIGVAAAMALAGAGLWHGPIGAANRFASVVERSARDTLALYEMSGVQAHLHRAPLSRRLLLSGPADDFQRSELVRIMSGLPGVGRATWDQSTGIPLIAELEIACALGFLLGLLLAYGIELRRRYNAQWEW
jgi:hypothetical protein